MKKLFYKHGESWRCDDGSIGSRNTVSLAQNFRIEEGDEQFEGEIESKKFSKRVFREMSEDYSVIAMFSSKRRDFHIVALLIRVIVYLLTSRPCMHACTRPLYYVTANE